MQEFSEANNLFLDHFKLSHDPFAQSPPGFKFFPARRRNLIEQLNHFARYGDFLLLVTGPSGSGKTMLRRVLVSAARQTTVNLVISAQHCHDVVGVLQSLAANLKSQATLDGIEQAIEQLVQDGKEVHVLVDDAQLLDEGSIMLLQRLAAGTQNARAAVYLFGTPALETLVQDAEKKNPQAGHHLIELEAWNEAEIEDYLRGRLQAAGRDLDIFTETELQRLRLESGGWPGVLNQLGKDMLMARMFDRPKRRVIPVLPYKYFALLFIIAFALVFIWYWQDGQPQPQAPEKAVINNSVSERPMVSSQRITEQQLRPVPELITEQLPLPEPAQPQPEQTQAPAPVQLEQPEQIKTVELSAEPEVAKPAPEPKPQTVAAPVTAPAKTAAPAAQQQRQPNSWYHQQPAQNFTLQLMATGSLDSVRKFASTDSQYHYFRKQHQGKYLYVLTYGSFASREQALAVQGRLPAQFRSNKPWPRTFASVVQEIR